MRLSTVVYVGQTTEQKIHTPPHRRPVDIHFCMSTQATQNWVQLESMSFEFSHEALVAIPSAS